MFGYKEIEIFTIRDYPMKLYEGNGEKSLAGEKHTFKLSVFTSNNYYFTNTNPTLKNHGDKLPTNTAPARQSKSAADQKDPPFTEKIYSRSFLLCKITWLQ